MSTDHPLHVQVAAALGWTELRPAPDGKNWVGVEPHGQTIVVPRYDSSWCSVGPLIDRFGLSVTKLQDDLDDQPHAEAHYLHQFITDGRTPCEAIAKLIVRLSKKGKLPK